jgi:hypothetical protein
LTVKIANVRSPACKEPSIRTLRGLDWLNFFLADVQTGVGPFLCDLPRRLCVERAAGWTCFDRWRNCGNPDADAGRCSHRPIAFQTRVDCDWYRSSNTVALVTIQILDGVGAGIFGVVSVLVIADLTQGTGRFNLTLGAISTAVGIGAALSQVIAGSIVHLFGYTAGFLFLGAVAAAAFGILYFYMPETGDKQSQSPKP